MNKDCQGFDNGTLDNLFDRCNFAKFFLSGMSNWVFNACVVAAVEFNERNEFIPTGVGEDLHQDIDLDNFNNLTVDGVKTKNLHCNEESFIDAVINEKVYYKQSLVTFDNFLYFTKHLTSFEDLQILALNKVTSIESKRREKKMATTSNSSNNDSNCPKDNIIDGDIGRSMIGKKEKAEDDSEICVICLDELEVDGDDDLLTTPCKHVYHKSCFRIYVESFLVKQAT
eukprot:Awhi_evm2s564